VILLVLLLLSLAGCAPDRYRVVRGPANLTIDDTPFTPGVTVAIEEGGSAYFGPTAPGEETPDGEKEVPAPAEELPAPGGDAREVPAPAEDVPATEAP